MSQTFDFYDARARESAEEAAVAVLDNVRERALRSEKTWRALADQARRVLIDRAKAESVKEARRAAVVELQNARNAELAKHLDQRPPAGEFRDSLGRVLPPMPRKTTR